MTDLHTYVEAGTVSDGDLHIASTIADLGADTRDDVVLATALCLAELRRGSVCVMLDDPPAFDVPWPADWRSTLASSPLVGCQDRPLRLVDQRLYLQRYWQDEQIVRTTMSAPPGPPLPAPEQAVEAMFAGSDPARSTLQRQAALTATLSRILLLAGGPGTGKTWTVSRILSVLAEVSGRELRVAVAAPTGKAASRLQESIANGRPDAAPEWIGTLKPSTIHRLLRRRPGPREAFRHDRANPLPHDVVIVDEMSMVSLPLMARLFEAIGPDTRLILIGDPDQLASVEAGAVFGDLVRMESGSDRLVTLTENFRFGGALKQLAEAMQAGRWDDAMDALRAGDNVEFVPDATDAIQADVETQARAVQMAADAGDIEGALRALDQFRLLCAHREGPHGVATWSRRIDAWAAAATGRTPGADPWYVGRPLIVNSNDSDTGVYNGETGVVVQLDGRRVAVIDQGATKTHFATTQLNDVDTLHAMTVHKAQGSQYREVTVILPPPDSPLLTRELFYTAITRAQDGVRIVGSEAAVRTALTRNIRRASGLGAGPVHEDLIGVLRR